MRAVDDICSRVVIGTFEDEKSAFSGNPQVMMV